MPYQLLFGLFTILSTSTASEDWPQWRGPNRDGQVASKAVWPDSLDDSHLQRRWRLPLGPSYSGPIVVGARVFVTETRKKATEVVQALDRKTGKPLWKVEWPGAMTVPFFAAANGSWIRSTPACDGERLYVAGIRDVLVCLDVETGDELWRVDFVKKFRSSLPGFGAVCSPLVDGDAVYLQAAGSVVKLNRMTGKIVWRSRPETSGALGAGMETSPFSSPVIATLGGVRQLVVQGRKALTGRDLATGELLWSQPVTAFRGMNILTPLVLGDTIFTSTYGGGSFLYAVTRDAKGRFSITERWRTTKQGYMSSPVQIGQDIYLHLRNRRFSCVDSKTGEAVWTTRPFGKYWSLVSNGRRILALDQRGDLRLIAAERRGYRELSQRKVSDAESWAHLAVAGDDIFVRGLNDVTAWKWRNAADKSTVAASAE